MKKLLILFFILLSIEYSFCQTDEDLPYLFDAPQIRSNELISPQIKALNVLRFSNSAQLIVDFLNTQQFINSTLLVKGKNIEYNSMHNIMNNHLALSNLPLDKEYDLVFINNLGNIVSLASFTTSKVNNLEVSKEMFDALGLWSNNQSTLSLFNYLLTLDNFSDAEKLNTIQHFYYNGDALPPYYSEGIPQNPDPPTILPSDCICKLVIVNSQDIIPNSGISNDGIATPFQYRDGENWSGSGYWNYTGDFTGASKNEFLYSRGKRDGGRGFANNKSKEGLSSHYGLIGYNLICMDGSGSPNECACSKTVFIDYCYDTKVSADAELPVCTFCGSKGASAITTDAATLIMSEIGGGNPKVLDANLIEVSMECNNTINRDFFVESVDLLVPILTAIGAGISTNSAGEKIFDISKITKETLESLTKELKELIKTPFRFKKGCEPSNENRTLICGSKSILLNPNKAVYIYLTSHSSLHSYGYTSWRTKNKCSSNFHLAGAVQAGYGTPQSSFCCFPFLGNWSLASAENAPIPFINECSRVGTFFNLMGAPINIPRHPATNAVQINSNVNQLRGALPNTCQDINVTSRTKFITTDNNRIRIENQATSYYYNIYSIEGRYLQSGKGYAGDTEIELSENDVSLPQVLLLEIINKESKSVYKIFKN